MTRPSESIVTIDGLWKRFGEETAVSDFNLSVAEGEFVTLLGPSGCGKTTTLRCIVGLEKPDAGTIRIGDRIVSSAKEELHLNPEDRDIGMVFQSYAVWPHMTVFDNVAYGLRVRRASSGELRKRTMETLELVGLDHLASRYATKLSGGQRQRVALARAIAYQPKVVLFDEPLSNLDAKLREQMRVEIVRMQREVGITSIFVTHDQSEALVMSDRIVVMDKAVIQQVGDPHTVYTRPANAFVANFIGVTSLLEGTLVAHDGGVSEIEVDTGAARAPLRLRAAGGQVAAPGSSVVLSLRPEDVDLHTQEIAASPELNVIEGEVIDTIYLGSFLEGRIRVGRHEIGIQITHYEDLAPGQTVYLSFRPDHGLCLTR